MLAGGRSPDHGHVIYFVGDFMNPDEAGGAELALAIERAIAEVLESGNELSDELH